MVVCPHALASAVGLGVLQQGGHAVDAAIALNAALGVVYPHMTGLGGDSFWLIYSAATQQVYGLNGSGRAGQQVNRERFHRQGLQAIPPRGAQAVLTVPGAVAAWGQAHQRFGRLPWAQLLQPAIDLARQGYPVSASQGYWTRRNQENFTRFSEAPLPFLPGGRVPPVGTWLTNPDLAKSLESLAEGGPEVFYRGNLAQRIVDDLTGRGGWLTREDFVAHASTWVDPISTTYRGFQVYQLPPNTQGFTVLQMLNLIEPFDLGHLGHGTADYYHLLVEATKLAYADRDRWLSDPAFVDIPLPDLISKTYADGRRARLRMDLAQPYAAVARGGDTTYSAVVDAEGNIVSALQSLYFDFGAAVVPPGLGFALHNRGALFALDSQAANCLAPGKRPFHTLIPALVRHRNGRPYLALGTMGGEGQPQTQLALLTRLLDFGFDPQTAIDLPRWLWGRTWGESATGLTLEGRIPNPIRQDLRARGHRVKVVPDWTDLMGHAHVLRLDPTGPALEGGSDPRSDGVALGLD
ncbi:MAG TPA: gamma-glutamyltransferase [Leptolyngbyaceae cyanobacterium M65_K2018_010]|nr:gamma-glutamyltransferase [Leptolyngbyaceae cyanobacterium M65_K2018_010]